MNGARSALFVDCEVELNCSTVADKTNRSAFPDHHHNLLCVIAVTTYYNHKLAHTDGYNVLGMLGTGVGEHKERVRAEVGYSPVRVRFRLRGPPQPVHSENLDQELKAQSSLQGTQQGLKRWGMAPAQRRQPPMATGSSSSPTQLTPGEAQVGKGGVIRITRPSSDAHTLYPSTTTINPPAKQTSPPLITLGGSA